MPYLDPYQPPLSASEAAHLLRRATFGPTKKEIADFTGLTTTQAIDKLIANVSRTSSPPPPVDFDNTSSTYGQNFLLLPFSKPRAAIYIRYISYWWTGLMCSQNTYPSLSEKLSAFWQNHFVVSSSVVMDYRMMFRYIQLIRRSCLGSFKTMAIEITKDPAMLLFQNGNENQKGNPNENYARELQELFVVGVRNFYGNENYTEEDVKAAARTLTGWQVSNYRITGSTNIDSSFYPDRHDETDKTFSEFYNNATITGKTGATAGEVEMEELIDMLLRHPESPKFICRKLYRWFVNDTVTEDIENNVIIPLSTLFSAQGNNFAIETVIRRLLTSQIFFDQSNRGANIKSPAEWTIGLLRHFDQPVPNIENDFDAFSKYNRFIYDQLSTLQYGILDQPSVFGYPAFYLTGYSENWINGSALSARNLISNRFVYPHVEIKPGYVIGIDFIKWLTALQPNFSDVTGTPPITVEFVFDEFSKYLFVFDLSLTQKNFLIDTIMLTSLARSTWTREWNNYRASPTTTHNSDVILYRCHLVMTYMLRMAEYQMC